MSDTPNDNATDNRETPVQTPSEGAGPRYHRVYAVDLPVTYERALQTMQLLKSDPSFFSPSLIATFEKTKGLPGEMKVGDEFDVHLTAPWRAPVRVSHVSEASFTFLTLQGHIEAGQIQFSVHRRPTGGSRFEIESITRSKDRLVDFIYDKLRIAQFAQSEMWELFCRGFAKEALEAGAEVPKVDVRTKRQDRETGCWQDVSDQLGAHGL